MAEDFSPVVDAVLGDDVPMVPASCLTLNSEGSGGETSYGVQCMLHLRGSLTSVVVSRIHSHPDTVEEDVIEVSACALATNTACMVG
jgi:hypothetical protein